MSQPANAPGATDKALQPMQVPMQGMPPLGLEPPHGPIAVQQQPEERKRLGWPTVIINAVAVLSLGSIVSGSGDARKTPRPLLRRLLSATLAACAALALTGCNGIPRETLPTGWTLDVHQAGGVVGEAADPAGTHRGALRDQADVGHRA